MAYTQADLQAIERAIAGCELEVQYADKKIKYRSMDELFRAKAEIVKELMPRKTSRCFQLRHSGKGV